MYITVPVSLCLTDVWYYINAVNHHHHHHYELHMPKTSVDRSVNLYKCSTYCIPGVLQLCLICISPTFSSKSKLLGIAGLCRAVQHSSVLQPPSLQGHLGSILHWDGCHTNIHESRAIFRLQVCMKVWILIENKMESNSFHIVLKMNMVILDAQYN